MTASKIDACMFHSHQVQIFQKGPLVHDDQAHPDDEQEQENHVFKKKV